MGFDKDAELDPRLSSKGAAALLAHYEEHFQGKKLCKRMKKYSQDDEEKKLAPRILKGIAAAFADLETLARAVDPNAAALAAAAEAEAEDGEASDDDSVADGEAEGEPEADGDDEPAATGVPDDATNEAVLRELYWRLHEGWSTAAAQDRADAAANLKMIAVNGGTPSWADLANMLGELGSLDREEGEGDTFSSEWYDDLLERFEAKLGKKRPKKKTSSKAAVIRTPPPGASLREYSAKATFREGEWVTHPKFGTGYVVEAGPNVLVEFGPEQKRLAHVPPAAVPSAGPKLKTKTPADTLELAKAAGIEIKKIPARAEDEEK